MGYGLYVVVYLSFGIFHSSWVIVTAWLMYGLYTAITEGVEKAFVSDLSPMRTRAYTLGLFSTIVGAGVLPANIIAGALYTGIGPAAPFVFGGVMALASWVIIIFFITERE